MVLPKKMSSSRRFQPQRYFQKRNLLLALSFCLGVAIAFVTTQAHAEILFEGYSKVMSGGVHVGYSVVRYDYDNKKKQFSMVSFLKTNELGGNLTESVKALATDDLAPISYQYTTLIGNQTKTIDAKFAKGKMIAEVHDGGKTQKIIKDLPKGTFISSFLAYVMLRSPTGIKQDSKYEYQAIAEEDAAVYKGTAVVKGEDTYEGLKAMKVMNDFKGTKFVSLINSHGEVFSTKSPAEGISSDLVAQPSLATDKMNVPSGILKTLFGDVPTGQKNELSTAKKKGSTK
jgi:hypothetical protein